MIDGSILIGASAIKREPFFQGIDPATGTPLEPKFSNANADDVAAACALAEAAAPALGATIPTERAAFLDAIAEAIVAIGDDLILAAMAETGLPRPRLEGERGRTVGQLRLFAQELRDGHWLEAVIDPALPERIPPRADLRRVNVALGPVAVFGASNFPLAFSVAGGDTASALAAGCPVIVKGHPAHPATGELVARAVSAAVERSEMPAGTFSYLPGQTEALGGALVADSRIKAVGFTGSRSGGLALAAIAARREEPIPVYAEMSSINPVLLLPGALASRGAELGTAFAASLTLGAGQFCTNPGLVIAIDAPGLDAFLGAASAALTEHEPAVMLSPGIHAAFVRGVAALDAHPATRKIAGSRAVDRPVRGSPALFETSADDFLADRALGAEVFGASALVVRCRDWEAAARVVLGLEGQLTATIHCDLSDHKVASELLPLLAGKVGRVLANGWPTGVEVSHAMVHGGPYPATTDGRTTSVGTLAMRRFLRPVCFQDVPEPMLPPALHDNNPWRIPRRRDGQWEVA